MKTIVSQSGDRPEDELLLCCARTSIDPHRADRIRALIKGNIDWKYLMSVAHAHRLTSLLYCSLRATCPGAVPPELFGELRRRFHANALSNSLLVRELVRILHVFEIHGVLAVPYKGPALAVSVYGSLELRKSGDLDILVRKQDVQRAKELLEIHRYRPLLNDFQEESFLRDHYHLTFARDDDAVFVELHWAFTYPYWRFPLDLERMEPHLESTLLAGENVHGIPDQELLLILCVHGAKDAWRHLVWVCDIAELVQKKEINWEMALLEAEEFRFRRVLFLGLFLAKTLLDAPLPPHVWRRVQHEPGVEALAAELRRPMFPAIGAETPAMDERTFFLKTRENFRDRARYFYEHHLAGSLPTLMLPNGEDRALLPLPGSLDFLYYFLRPLRLAAVYGPRLPILLVKYLAAW